MKIAIFLTVALVVLTIVHAENSTLNSTANLINVAQENARCGKEFECKITSYSEKLFWFNCYYDEKDSACRCYKGDITSCNVKKSSVTIDDLCAYQFECADRGDGTYQFNCYFDAPLNQCRCFVGDLSQCRADKSLLNKSELLAAEQQKAANKSKANESLPITGESVLVNAPRKPSSTSKTNSSAMALIELASKNPVTTGVVLFALIALLLLVIIFARSSGGDSLEKARRFHRKAEELHENGNEEEAHRYYELAEKYRAKARGAE